MDSFPIKVYRGDKVTYQFTITQSDETAMSLVGATIYCMVKKLLSDTDANAKFSGTCTNNDEANGKTRIVDFQVIEAGSMIIELEYRKGTDVRTLKQWKTTVTDDVRKGT